MEHYGVSPSLFADKIGVQRSSVSHILNGRNRPSLDFIMKVIQTFPEVNIYWLLNGKGSLLLTDETSSPPPPPNPKNYIEKSKKGITKIAVFYDDGTFESFEPKK